MGGWVAGCVCGCVERLSEYLCLYRYMSYACVRVRMGVPVICMSDPHVTCKYSKCHS